MKESQVKHTKFNLLIWRNLPPCREIVKIITASFDGKVSWKDRILMRIHLLSCDPCVNFLKQLKFLRLAIDRQSHHAETASEQPQLSSDARDRIKQNLLTSFNTM